MFDYPSKRAEKAAKKGSVEAFKSAVRHSAHKALEKKMSKTITLRKGTSQGTGVYNTRKVLDY